MLNKLYQQIVGCSIFFLILPFVVIPINRFPLGSTGAVLLGAFLMTITNVIEQKRVYEIIGEHNNLKTIFLLWGMMILSSYFERERLINKLLNKSFPIDLSFQSFLFRISILSALLSSIFTNDVACVILTPLILDKWNEQKRDISQLNTLLLALATQANIGSILTIFGNPQMALIASKSNGFINRHSRLDLKTCVIYLWLPTFIVWLLNLLFLQIYYRLTYRADETNINQPNQLIDFDSIKNSSETCEHLSSNSNTLMVNRSISVASFLTLNELIQENQKSFQPSKSRLFQIILFLLLIIVISLLFISNGKLDIDIGLLPVGAAILLLVSDTLINHRSPMFILTRIDWNILLLFFGLFIWLDGLNSTGLPRRIWNLLKIDTMSLNSIKSRFIFFLFILIASNMFSNVPLTLLVLEQLPQHGEHLNLILYLAFLTTIAGNLTLFGSIANLIVAQKALSSSFHHRFTFWIYFKYGFLTTILLSFIGMFTIHGLIQIIPK